MTIESSTDRSQAVTISNGITRLHREHSGRGATIARTIIERDYVVCFLEDIYTPVERTLIEAGRQEDVGKMRHLFQQAMRPNFIQCVEDATGRKVVQFMSQVAFAPDMAVEVFVLEPEAGDATSP